MVDMDKLIQAAQIVKDENGEPDAGLMTDNEKDFTGLGVNVENWLK